MAALGIAVWRWARLGLLALVLTWLALGVLVWLFQRRLIYFPSTGPVDRPHGPPWDALQVVDIKTADDLTLKAWYLPGRHAGTVLIFHGNAGDRGDRLGMLAELHERGWGVLLPDYRGYGGNAGSPSEAGFRLDAEACRAWLEAEVPGPVVYLGSSIGGGVAVHLASTQPPAGLILLSPFNSMADVARKHYPWLPVGPFLRDRYENDRKIGAIECPLLVIHGDRDRIVPLKLGRALYDAAPEPKRWLTIEGARHNDLALVAPAMYWDALDSFLRACVPE